MNIDELVDTLKQNGGFSVRVNYDEFAPLSREFTPVGVPGQFAASIKGAEETFPVDLISALKLRDYLRRHKTELCCFTSDGDAIFGGWIDNGTVYLDVTHLFDNQDEARAFAVKNSQKGYFDFATFETIRLDGQK